MCLVIFIILIPLNILIEMIDPRSLRKQFSSKVSPIRKYPRKLSKIDLKKIGKFV